MPSTTGTPHPEVAYALLVRPLDDTSALGASTSGLPGQRAGSCEVATLRRGDPGQCVMREVRQGAVGSVVREISLEWLSDGHRVDCEVFSHSRAVLYIDPDAVA